MRVTFGALTYECLQAHTAWVGAGWTPPTSPTLWKLAGTAPAPAPAPPPPSGALTDPRALRAVQDKRVYVGYYPSWSDNWFSADAKTANEVYAASMLARVPANYTHVVVSFGDPNFSWQGLTANTWNGTGLNFSAAPRDIKAAIDVLRQRNIRVLLAIGGATYHQWDPLAAEGRSGVAGPVTTALANIMRDLGFDGLDVDYESDENVERYAMVTAAMRRAVNLAGGGRMLSAATWSTGADCTALTSADPACAGRISYWGGSAGRERLLMSRFPAIARSIDMVSVMTYDARFENYDGVLAYQQYRALWPAGTIVSIGFQPAPEGWAGGQLVVRNTDAQCAGSNILRDQYGRSLNLPYSVERFTVGVLGTPAAQANPRDGAMLWSIRKPASGSCGAATLASPGTIGKLLAPQLGLTDDPLLQSAEWK